MRTVSIIWFLCTLTIGKLLGQNFNLTDTIVEVGSIHQLKRTFLIDVGSCVGQRSISESYYYEAEIDSIRQFLEANPTVVLEIGAHTDLRGTEEFHLAFSNKQVEYIADKLMELGIKPDRLVAKGYGEQKPLFDQQYIDTLSSEEEKEELHQLNKRIELKVLKL